MIDYYYKYRNLSIVCVFGGTMGVDIVIFRMFHFKIVFLTLQFICWCCYKFAWECDHKLPDFGQNLQVFGITKYINNSDTGH